jgi:probable F420-dependent oxidoreductase
MAAMRAAWKQADEMGADSIWVWDHFFPLYGDGEAGHFEGWTVLAAMAADTTNAKLGTLVTGNSYRNPELLADMARTVDHISDGRAYLGIGSGWFERDYEEYGYDFGTAIGRLRQLGDDLPRIRARLDALIPAPIGDLPLLIGGSGEKVTLKLTAEFADAWNTFGPPDHFAQKSGVLDDWCAELGRDPSEIERTVAVQPDDVDDIGRYVEAGADHVIVMVGPPYDLAPLESLIAQRDTLG